MDDLEGQYCNRNSIGCSAPSLASAWLSFFQICCRTTLRNLIKRTQLQVPEIKHDDDDYIDNGSLISL